MNFKLGKYLAALLMVMLLGSGCSAGESVGGGEGAAAEGSDVAARRTAPDFTLPNLSGEPITLSSLRGKTVVIDFWATWCPPCVFQIPILNEFYETHREAGVEVLAISVDVEGQQVVAPYAEENDIRYPVLLGDQKLARQFDAPGFPALVVVAPDGSIDSMHVGLVEAEELEAAIARVKGS